MILELLGRQRRKTAQPSPDTNTVTTPTSKPKRLAAIISGLAMAFSLVALPTMTASPAAQAAGCEVTIEALGPTSVPGTAGSIRVRGSFTLFCTMWNIAPESGSWMRGGQGGALFHSGGVFEVDLTYDANPTNSSRQTIIVANGTGVVAHLVVTQGAGSGPSAYVNVQDKLSVPAEGGIFCVPVSYNTPGITVRANNPWLMASVYGCKSNEISVYAERNTGDARTGSVRVEGTGYSSAYDILTVTQEGSGSTISFSDAGTYTHDDSSAFTISPRVYTNQSSWSSSTLTSWLHVNSTGTNGQTMTISADDNPDPTQRKGYVTVKAGSATKSYAVIQPGLDPNAPNVRLGTSQVWLPEEGGESGFFVFTNQPGWTATSSKPWLTISAESGVNGTWLVATAEPNADATRVAVVRFTAGPATATFTVTQYGEDQDQPPYISLDTTTCDVGYEQTTCTVTVSTNWTFGWNAYPLDTWLGVVPQSGMDGDQVTITIRRNDSYVDRTGKVQFMANNQEAILTVNQKGAPTPPPPPPPVVTVSVDPASWEAPTEGGTASFTVSTTDSSWTATSDQPWLTLSAYSGVDGDTVDVTAEPYMTLYTPRTAVVTVTTPSGAVAMYTVTQHEALIPKIGPGL